MVWMKRDPQGLWKHMDVYNLQHSMVRISKNPDSKINKRFSVYFGSSVIFAVNCSHYT